MKRIFILIFCIIMIFCTTACTRVIVSSADELCMNSWEYRSENGMNASLEFSGEKAKLIVESASSDEAHTVEGTYSVDSENLYITDTSKYKTYTFSYEVYADRVYLTYMNGRIKFTRIDK